MEEKDALRTGDAQRIQRQLAQAKAATGADRGSE
jgi:hypothetical protein